MDRNVMPSWITKVTDTAKSVRSKWLNPSSTSAPVEPMPLAAAPTPVKTSWWDKLVKVGQPEPRFRAVPLVKVGEELDANTRRRGALYCKGVLARARARKATCAEAVNGARIANALGARSTAVALAKYARACR